MILLEVFVQYIVENLLLYHAHELNLFLITATSTHHIAKVCKYIIIVLLNAILYVLFVVLSCFVMLHRKTLSKQ